MHPKVAGRVPRPFRRASVSARPERRAWTQPCPTAARERGPPGQRSTRQRGGRCSRTAAHATCTRPPLDPPPRKQRSHAGIRSEVAGRVPRPFRSASVSARPERRAWTQPCPTAARERGPPDQRSTRQRGGRRSRAAAHAMCTRPPLDPPPRKRRSHVGIRSEVAGRVPRPFRNGRSMRPYRGAARLPRA